MTTYISDDATDEQLITWVKTLRDDKKLLYAVSDLLDTIFSKASADFVISGKDQPPVKECGVVMKYLEELGGFEYGS
jgi:hypothetical protein